MTKTTAGRTLLVAAATAVAWAVWLSWEAGYTTAADTGAVSGPYAWWQVAGCTLTLAAVAAVGGRLLNPLLVAATMAATFTVAWSAKAAAADDSGLWPVGAILVFAGTAAGTAVAAAAARRVFP